MKKTFTRHDGTEVTVEGTPEELAAYEKQLNEGKPVTGGKKRPGVLKGLEAEAALRKIIADLQELKDRYQWLQIYTSPFAPSYRIYTSQFGDALLASTFGDLSSDNITSGNALESRFLLASDAAGKA